MAAEVVSTTDTSDSVVFSLKELARGFAMGTSLEVPSSRSESVKEVSLGGVTVRLDFCVVGRCFGGSIALPDC